MVFSATVRQDIRGKHINCRATPDFSTSHFYAVSKFFAHFIVAFGTSFSNLATGACNPCSIGHFSPAGLMFNALDWGMWADPVSMVTQRASMRELVLISLV
jgi:hypothetical protein